MDSPVPTQYRQLVNTERTSLLTLPNETRDLSSRLVVKVTLDMSPAGLHFTAGVESKVQVSLSDEGEIVFPSIHLGFRQFIKTTFIKRLTFFILFVDGEVISFQPVEIDRQDCSFECQLATHHANSDLQLKVRGVLTLHRNFSVRHLPTLSQGWKVLSAECSSYMLYIYMFSFLRLFNFEKKYMLIMNSASFYSLTLVIINLSCFFVYYFPG